MNTMKKIAFAVMAFVCFSGKVHAGYQYVTSTNSAQVVVSSVAQNGSVDVMSISVSSGYQNGAYFVCIDTPSQPTNKGVALPAIGAYNPNDYFFPPIALLPSTATVTGQALQTFSLEGLYGGQTVQEGLTCMIVGDTTNQYVWTIKFASSLISRRR